MSKIKRLLQSYAAHIQVPWREVAAAQRVIFCVYPETDELRLRARIEEFELATKNAGHGWDVFDLTDTFARWLASGRYAEKWFKQPQLIASILPKYQDYLVAQFRDFLTQRNPSDNDAVALTGVGSLFGFAKVRDVVEKLSGLVHGRLVVFFPGSAKPIGQRVASGRGRTG